MPVWRGCAVVVGDILCCQSALLPDRAVAGRRIVVVIKPELLDAVA
jgi:hypothetical protein